LSSVRKLSLQVIDADEDVKDPMFELHDDVDFLKDAEVDITILERMVSCLVTNGSCLTVKSTSPNCFRTEDKLGLILDRAITSKSCNGFRSWVQLKLVPISSVTGLGRSLKAGLKDGLALSNTKARKSPGLKKACSMSCLTR
jgi:hypothetical protein